MSRKGLKQAHVDFFLDAQRLAAGSENATLLLGHIKSVRVASFVFGSGGAPVLNGISAGAALPDWLTNSGDKFKKNCSGDH